MLLVNGSGEGASTQGTSVESPSSASSAPSSDSSSIKWIAGIAVLIFLAFILFILLANKGKDDAPSGVPGVEYGADYQDPENDAPRYEDYN